MITNKKIMESNVDVIFATKCAFFVFLGCLIQSTRFQQGDDTTSQLNSVCRMYTYRVCGLIHYFCFETNIVCILGLLIYIQNAVETFFMAANSMKPCQTAHKGAA